MIATCPWSPWTGAVCIPGSGMRNMSLFIRPQGYWGKQARVSGSSVWAARQSQLGALQTFLAQAMLCSRSIKTLGLGPSHGDLVLLCF